MDKRKQTKIYTRESTQGGSMTIKELIKKLQSHDNHDERVLLYDVGGELYNINHVDNDLINECHIHFSVNEHKEVA